MPATIPDELAHFLETILNSEAGKSIQPGQVAALQTLAAQPRISAAPKLMNTGMAFGDGDEVGCDVVTELPIVDTGSSTDVDTDQTVDANWPPLGSGDSGSTGDSGAGDSGAPVDLGDGGGGGSDDYWWR